jgi:hypothetical protein
MSIQPFKLERYFARYEFSIKYVLSSSDCESLGMDKLLGMASPESRAQWDGLKLGYQIAVPPAPAHRNSRQLAYSAQKPRSFRAGLLYRCFKRNAVCKSRWT